MLLSFLIMISSPGQRPSESRRWLGQQRVVLELRLSLTSLHAGFEGEVGIGLGRIVALHYRSSTLYQIRKHIRCLYF